MDYDSGCGDASERRISRETGYKQQKFVHFVRDAVYAVAYALHDLFVERCGREHQGMCEALQHIDGTILAKYLANVSFKGKDLQISLVRTRVFFVIDIFIE